MQVSDLTGFGSGGTSTAQQVTSSDDSSCYNASTSVVSQWVFNIEPQSQIAQCQPTRLWWDPSKVKGNVSFLGVIPGGNSSKIPEGQITDKWTQGLGTGFNWTPNIRAGTVLHIVASDGRGIGNGGSKRATVGDSINGNNSCLNDQSPSSTVSGPVPSITAPESRPSSAPKTPETPSSTPLPVVAIAVSAIGGFLIFGLIAFILRCYLRKRRSAAGRQTSPLGIDPFLTQPSEKNAIPSKSDDTDIQQRPKQPEVDIVVHHDVGRDPDTKVERRSLGSDSTTATNTLAVSQNGVEGLVNVAPTSRREVQTLTTDELAVELNQRLQEEGRWDVDESLPEYLENNHRSSRS
ncbi:hypothetical protein PQX77_005680 [Marasmius sp. AFHP31]|nr:hypothetical protein PQX77_005680 [Marasmius sp. AFHP31]